MQLHKQGRRPRLPWDASWDLPSEAAWHELGNLTAFALQQRWPAGQERQHGGVVFCSNKLC